MDGEDGGEKRECVENGGVENSSVENGGGKNNWSRRERMLRSRNLRPPTLLRLVPVYRGEGGKLELLRTGMEESWKTAAWTKNWGEPDQFSLFFKGVC